MKHFDLFSGYGGFSLALERAYENKRMERERVSDNTVSRGQETVNGSGVDSKQTEQPSYNGFELRSRPETIGFSEIDKYASAVLKYHWPNIKNYGDITKIDWTQVPDFDILTGGSPCQDLSIAGKRAGLGGKRSGLFFEFMRAVKEKKPRYFIWENVKGALSSNRGWDFAAVLNEMAEAGYSLWWQVLNAKDFGVPQNRERIFVVGFRNDIGQIPEIDLEWYYKERQRQTNANNETMYLLQKGVATYARELLLEKTSSQSESVSREQMQGLLEEIRQGIQTGESDQIERYSEKIQPESEGNIQEVGEVQEWLESNDNTESIFGVVSAPTEEMLLLWNTRNRIDGSQGQVQQQVDQIDNRQNGLISGLRSGEFSTLLLSVQPYKERLFYSLGDGKDWSLIYISQMEKTCQTSLSSILETEVHEKYFLSEEQTIKITSKL